METIGRFNEGLPERMFCNLTTEVARPTISAHSLARGSQSFGILESVLLIVLNVQQVALMTYLEYCSTL